MSEEAEKPTGPDWDQIRVEWDAGQLDIAEIARQNGVTGPAISLRAKRKGWPPRPPKTALVTQLVTAATRDGPAVTNPRIALTAFHRAIQLLLRHRRFLGMLSTEFEQCFMDIQAIRAKKRERGQTLRLDEVEGIMNCVAKAAQAVAKLIPLERRAFGFDDSQAPSEFDGLTESELDAVEQTFRKALGLAAEKASE
jgi:hypothetical protein